jgi:glycosyltransferase involved in cell wall biosynthesis
MHAVEPRPGLSFVVPMHDEAGNVDRVHADVTRVAAGLGIPYEIVAVNDGSRDATLDRLLALQARDPHLSVVDLAGNFGESSALSAGFAHARGELVVTLDGDGQNDPGDLPKLLAALGDDVDVVSGRRTVREEDALTRVLPSRVANGLIRLVTGVGVHDTGCALKVYRRRVVADARLPRGMHRFLPAILGVGPDRVCEVEVSDRPRESGRSHYGLSRVLVVVRDLIGLRLVLTPPRAGRGTAAALAVTAAALVLGGAGGLAAGHAWLGLAAWIAAAAALAARYDVTRFLTAESTGVYRVRRFYDGRDADSDRDRRGGVLGIEPAADVPGVAVRAGDRAV